MSRATISRRRSSSPLTKIEFVDSPQFQQPGASHEILAPLPEVEDHTGRTAPPPDTPLYLAALYAYPVLTREQEHHLFRQMNYLKYRADDIRRRLPVGERRTAQLDQMQAFLFDALALRNRLVECNLRLVVSIAKTLVDSANRLEDLISEGNGPLIRAVEIFDFRRGTRFSTYATWAVRHHLYRVTRRNRRRQQWVLADSEALGVVPAGAQSSSSSAAEGRELQNELERALQHLDRRDRSVVRLRFGLGAAGEPLMFRQIAERLGVSTERARQLLARSLERLREFVDPE